MRLRASEPQAEGPAKGVRGGLVGNQEEQYNKGETAQGGYVPEHNSRTGRIPLQEAPGLRNETQQNVQTPDVRLPVKKTIQSELESSAVSTLNFWHSRDA